MKILKSLKDFNTERFAALKQANVLKGNGIACPRCASEMVDSDEQFHLASMPPKVRIECPRCGNWDYRLA